MSNITGILSLAAMSGAWIEMNESARSIRIGVLTPNY
jgi:hypothetical protein